MRNLRTTRWRTTIDPLLFYAGTTPTRTQVIWALPLATSFSYLSSWPTGHWTCCPSAPLYPASVHSTLAYLSWKTCKRETFPISCQIKISFSFSLRKQSDVDVFSKNCFLEFKLFSGNNPCKSNFQRSWFKQWFWLVIDVKSILFNVG